MSYKQTPRSSFAHNNRRLQYSYINNPNVSCREYTHYIANMTKVRKITFRGNEVLDRLYNTSLNKYKNERIKELQKKYAINSTKKKKVNMDRIAELFAGGIKNKNKAEQEKEKMLQEVKKPVKRSIVSSNNCYVIDSNDEYYNSNSSQTTKNNFTQNNFEYLSDNFNNLSQVTDEFGKQRLLRTSSVSSFSSFN